MAEPPDPRRKSQIPQPPAPLPRIWKADPPPEEASPEGASKGKGKRAAAESDPAPESRPRKKKGETRSGAEKRADGTTKIEETPKFDTYETRQKVRWIIGSVMAAVVLVLLFVVIRKARQQEPEIVNVAPDPRTRIAAEAKSRYEQEAKNLLDNARSAAKNGQETAAVDLFDKLAKSYPNTVASREAMEALDRHRRKLPLLGPSPTTQPTGPQTPPPGRVAVAASNKTPVASVEPLGPKPPDGSTATEPRPPAEAGVAGPVRPLKSLPAGFKAKSGTVTDPSGWPMEIVGLRDSGEMVFVPGGTFTMGRDDGDPPERPAHQVRLASYYIDRHEVTVRQFQQFVKETGRVVEPPRPSAKETAEPTPPSDDQPIVNVGARDARAYCVWAGKSLPTEAQWERAARGEDGRIFPWGSEPPPWGSPRNPKQLEAVMRQATDLSPVGAFDMAGNAWEWTGDIYDSRYFQQFAGTVVRDPVGPSQGRSRPTLVTVKGGSKTFQVFWRDGVKVEQRLPYLGFRGALQAEKPEPPAPVPASGTNSGPMAPGSSGGVVPF